MSETPMKNYENYVKLMDTFTINEELAKINAIHHSLDETNYITYAILLETNRKWFTESQIKWIEERIANLQNQLKQNLQKSLESLDFELASAPILEKSSDVGTRLF
jgi:dihydroneopterin aldolase